MTGVFSGGIALNAEFVPYSIIYGVCYVIGTVGYLGAVGRGSLLITVIRITRISRCEMQRDIFCFFVCCQMCFLSVARNFSQSSG